jgi:hypothetical protein
MAVLTVTADYDCRFWTDNTNYSKYDDLNGYIGAGGKGADYNRVALRFPLTDLPSNAQISQVRLYVYCKTAGSSTHLLDIHAYGTNGQDDPSADDAQTGWNRCASGNLYVDDSPDLRTTGDKWFILGGSIAQDIINAKNNVNRFALGLHEEGDNDTYAAIAQIGDTNYPYPAKLEITYEAAAPPPAAQYYIGDSLSTVIVNV